MFYVHKKCKISDFKFPKVISNISKVWWVNCTFSALCSSERILQIDQELTKLWPWLGWHPFFDSRCIYRVRQKVAPLEFFFSFLRIALQFQGEILRMYVVIIYVHIGINNI